MSQFFVGVGKIDLIFRHARTLKDKRNTMQSLVQKLKNRGFSVVDCGEPGHVKSGVIGFSVVGRSHERVTGDLDSVDVLLIGDFQLVSYDKNLFDYSAADEDQGFLEEDEMPWEKS